MSELITIVVPIYKVEDYLHRCVNSLLEQTYKNLEIILVNDGSPDGCGAICDEYAKFDDRIKVIHKTNGGLSDARNAGIEAAQGNYISFVDSDDWVHQEFISNLYKLLVKTNSDISICNFIKTSSESINLEITTGDTFQFNNYESLKQLTNDKYYIQMVVAWGKLYKRSLFDNIRFPIGRVHEDEFITYKLLYKANKVVLTTSQLLYYWQRQDSIMGSGFNIKHKNDIFAALEERAEFFSKVGYMDLSNNTYKVIFKNYISVSSKINATKTKQELNISINTLKKNLRNGSHGLAFKIFFELYFLLPSLIITVYKVYKFLKKHLNSMVLVIGMGKKRLRIKQ